MKKIKSIVVGAAGKMGSRIIHVIHETPSIDLFEAVERKDHPSIGRDIGEMIGLGRIGVPLEAGLREGGDVIVDFTNPKSSLESMKFAHETA